MHPPGATYHVVGSAWEPAHSHRAAAAVHRPAFARTADVKNAASVGSVIAHELLSAIAAKLEQIHRITAVELLIQHSIAEQWWAGGSVNADNSMNIELNCQRFCRCRTLTYDGVFNNPHDSTF